MKVDGGDELADRSEAAAADGLPGDDENKTSVMFSTITIGATTSIKST